MFSSIAEAEKERDILVPRYKELLQIFSEKKKGDKHKYFAWKASNQARELSAELERVKARLEQAKKYINANRPEYLVDHDILISRLVDAIFLETKLQRITPTDATREVIGMAVRYLKSRPTPHAADKG